MIRSGILALGLALALSSGASAQSQPAEDETGLALATVMAVAGPARARLRPFTSFDAPASIDIGAGSQVTIVHHRSCQKVEISGGTVEIGFAGLMTTGIVARTEQTPCPAMTTVQAPGVAGGVLLRSNRAAPSANPMVGVTIEGGARVKAGSSIRMTVTAGIRAAIFVFDQDQSGVLTLIQKPQSGGGSAVPVPASTPVAVPDRPGARIQAGSDPGEGRIIAFAVPPERTPCGYLDLFETGPAARTLQELTAAIRDRTRAVAACAPVPRPPVTGEALYAIVR